MDEILVIGAGASGLMAARKLSGAGKRVRIIEARECAGGRILTIPAGEFSMRVEAGAEFIHGDLDLTIQLLKNAGISYHKTKGEIFNARTGEFHQQDDFIEQHKLLARKLKELTMDISVSEFLKENFNEPKYDSIRASISGYVQGYDLADLDKASTFSLRDEWLNEDDDDQYRIDKGYAALIDYLKFECEKNKCLFHFNTIIKKIEWAPGRVRLISSDQKFFEASKVVITVPLGIWRADVNEKAYLHITPSIEDKVSAARALGYGEVIKFILEFNDQFWERKEIVGKKCMKNLGFLFSDSMIPTWWTQAPVKSSILTGWFGGPNVRTYKHLNNESLLQLATDSLCHAFNIDHSVVSEKLVAWKICNWATDDFSLGGYAYPSIGREKHLSVFAKPVEQTLFVSGEALAWGSEVGTVEAALIAGDNTAEQVLQS